MKRLPNEEEIIQSNADKIMLTNHRIILTDSVWGYSYTNIIFLEDISSIEIKYRSSIIYIFIGIISVLAGVFLAGRNNSGQILLAGFILGIFMMIWWFSRNLIISISPNGGSSIIFSVSGISDDKINDFIYEVSLAKQKRVNQLHKI